MLTVNYSRLREKMKTLFDRVTSNYEVLIVTHKNNANVVVLSEETYNNLLENTYYEWLIESKNQYTNQHLKARDLIE